MPLNSSCRENGDIVITSGDRLTIENAGDFLRLLQEGLEASGNVQIEFENAVEVDITALQLLCSACKSAAVSGKNISYSGTPPQELNDLIASCGAERHAICKHNNDSTCIWFGGEK